MIKVFLVDDQPVMRQAVSSWLGIEPDMQVIGEAESGEAAIHLVTSLQPDVVLMDIDMPAMDGIATTAALHDVAPGSAVVILSMHDDTTVQDRARQAGAAAFVSKHQALDELVHVIRRVAGLDSDSAEARLSAAPA
jgi:DNA-binding NarL/FixJ family response regulator